MADIPLREWQLLNRSSRTAPDRDDVLLGLGEVVVHEAGGERRARIGSRHD